MRTPTLHLITNMVAPEFKVTFTPTAAEMSAKFTQASKYKIPLAMKRAMDSAMPEVIRDIQENRLSGKGPFPPSEHRLGEVTGTLKSAVTPIDSTMQVDDNSATITGGITVIGVPYAAVHEFGYSGSQSVSSHSRSRTTIRTTSASGRLLKRPKKTVTQHSVKGFSRNVNFPERAPFRTGMQENLVKIRSATEVELGRALENI